MDALHDDVPKDVKSDDVTLSRLSEVAAHIWKSVEPTCRALGPAVKACADEVLLENVERQHFEYFLRERDPQTGLTYDRSADGSPSSIAAVGFALTSYPCAVKRQWMSRDDAAAETLKVLNTLWNAPQGEEAEGKSGAHGLFYHFLNPADGTRAGKCELSPIDTALLMNGVLFARNYFDGANEQEKEIRDLATKLYERVDWNWAMNGEKLMPLAWSPEEKFSPFHWQGYDEGMGMMLLAMGSPTHPIPADSWKQFHATDEVTEYGGTKHIAFPPLFGHQYSHVWVDFRGIKDDQNNKLGMDYFENSRRATYAQNYYARKNPNGFHGYNRFSWGFTASDGPNGYGARGAPNGFDDGTIAPTAAIASLPFAPELVLPTLYNWRLLHPELWTERGFTDAFNPSAKPEQRSGWIDKDTLGIDQGPIVTMIENYRSGLIWKTMQKDAAIQAGLRKAGFTGGWLDAK